MIENMPDPFRTHGGILVPLDMFRVSLVAAVMGETLVSKARNVLDANAVLTRHPEAPLVLIRIEGSVVGDDPAAFWRENGDLVAAVSQVVPRQAFLYFVDPGPGKDRREGFVVAQRGQVLAADEATAESMPTGTPDTEWPVSRLCEQMRISMQELANGFAGGPQLEVSILEPHIDDQQAIMTLAGQTADTDEEEPAPPPQAGARPPADARTRAAAQVVQADDKRRAAQQAEQQAEMQRRVTELAADLPYARDELGIVVAPRADLSDPELLKPYIVGNIDGDLPAGLPRTLAPELQGKRLDLAIRIEFLSEVFLENTPLSRPAFEQHSVDSDLGGLRIRTLEVLAPRLGYGTLVARERRYVFVSRRLGTPIPPGLVIELLER